MSEQIGKFLFVLTFFSRLPLSKSLGARIPDDLKLSNATVFFPLVGLLIGSFPAVVWYAAVQVVSPLIAAGLAIATGLIITGALHEDGIADCADGLGATPHRGKALEIMRDSRIGTYGALALIVSVGLRWVALSVFAAATGFLALLIAYPASRAAIVIAMRFSNYARDDGLGKMASGETSGSDFSGALIISVGIALIFGWLSGLFALVLGLLTAWLFLKYLEHRLGGYTGDGLGAMQQLTEITILITLAGLWT